MAAFKRQGAAAMLLSVFCLLLVAPQAASAADPYADWPADVAVRWSRLDPAHWTREF